MTKARDLGDNAQNTKPKVINAKGDLIVGTGSDAADRLAVSDNGSTLVADSSASTGLRWQGNYAAGKNFLINGNFDIFQRGSFASQTVSGYSLDRWNAGIGGTVTISQQSSGAPIGSQFYMRTAYNGGGGNYANQHNTLESSMVQMLVGQTVTFSVLVRANASYVATSGQGFQIAIDKNATANTAVGGSWSTIASTNVAAATIPTGTGSSNWLKVSVTAAIPNDGTANGLRVRVGELVTGPSGAYWEMAQAQLEIGSVATPFTRAGGNIAGELAACQRYYYRVRGDEGSSGITNNLGLGTFYSATVFRCPIRYPVKMRRIPDFASSNSANHFLIAANGGVPTYSSVTLDTASVDASLLNVAVTSATGGQSGWLQTNNASAFVDFSAEL